MGQNRIKSRFFIKVPQKPWPLAKAHDKSYKKALPSSAFYFEVATACEA